MNKTYRILSIDAWGNKKDGYEWNNWFTVGEIDSIPDTNKDIIQLMIDEGFLKPGVNKLVEIDDDQYNLVILDKKTKQPLFAIEYGNHN